MCYWVCHPVSSSIPMSSSSATGFDWDLLKISSSDSTASAAASASTSTTPRELSGESGGGSSKRFSLLVIDSVSSACVCAGYVGKGGLKHFCTQRVSTPGSTCFIGKSHFSNKFKLSDDTFYVRATNQAAFCFPSYPHALVLNDVERERIRTSYKTQPEWKAYFSELEARQSLVIGKVPDEVYHLFKERMQHIIGY